METGQQREVIHRVSADHIVEVDEGSDLLASAENVPKREVFVDKTALRQVEQCLVAGHFGGDFGALLTSEKTTRNEEGEVLVESQMEVVSVGTARA